MNRKHWDGLWLTAVLSACAKTQPGITAHSSRQDIRVGVAIMMP